MDKKLVSVVLSLVGVLAFFLLIIWIGGMMNESLQLDEICSAAICLRDHRIVDRIRRFLRDA